jgi:hypothetical protein
MRKIVLDFTATTLSVLFLQLFFEVARMNVYINWELIIFDSITGIFSYWIVLFLFNDKSEVLKIRKIVYAVVFGSIIWALLHAAYLIHFDWKYLSDVRPEGLYKRSIETVKTALLYFVPQFSISAFLFIFAIRFIEKYMKNCRYYRRD